jgi:Zn-dependent peptidase ImmA (M78 family)/DNA-binding XRE family transcriptional regulator
MNRAYPDRIKQARELAGYSKTELAEALEVSLAAVSQWESGVKHPTAENIAALAHKLEVPGAMFLRPLSPDLARKGLLTFRAWKTARTRHANRQAERMAELLAEIFFWLEERVSFPAADIPELDSIDDPEEAAIACRRAWGLGDRPLLKLGELLESKGIVLGTASFQDIRFDAFSCIINGRPFILLGNEKQDRARSRFDACHELGHLVMHQHITELEIVDPQVLARIEAEANAFASAFLLPAVTFCQDVLDTSLNGFLKLKTKWGVAAQAMAVRAYDLGILLDAQYRQLFRQMSAKGWRKAKGEPFDDLLPVIKPTLGKKSLAVLEANEVLHSWEIPATLPFPIKVLNDVFQTDFTRSEPTELGKIIALPDFRQKPSSDARFG